MQYRNFLAVLIGLYSFSPIYLLFIGPLIDHAQSSSYWAAYPYGCIITFPLGILLLSLTLFLLRPDKSNLNEKAGIIAVSLIVVTFLTYTQLL